MTDPSRRLFLADRERPFAAPAVGRPRIFARPWHRALLTLFAASWAIALGLLALCPDCETMLTTLLATTGLGSVSGLGLASWVVVSALSDAGPT